MENESTPLSDEALRALFEDTEPGIHPDLSREKMDAILQDPDRYFAMAREVRGEQARIWVEDRLAKRRAEQAHTLGGRLINLIT
jgi:hypothetical protein